MKIKEWITIDPMQDNWPKPKKRLYCKTTEGYAIAHTNSTTDIIFDDLITLTHNERDILRVIKYKYLTESQYQFLRNINY
jgi:hypothetical protein